MAFLHVNNGVRRMSKDEKYIGDRLPLQKKRDATFESLINKIKSKIESWKAPRLSQAKRNVLIKSVASEIPIYNMFVLQISKSITNQINKCRRRFW